MSFRLKLLNDINSPSCFSMVFGGPQGRPGVPWSRATCRLGPVLFRFSLKVKLVSLLKLSFRILSACRGTEVAKVCEN